MNKKQIDAQLSNALKRVLFNKGKLGKNIYLKKFGITRMECQKIFSSHFLEGMSWNNHGIWWIDHLTPKSWFYYTNIDDAEVWNCWRENHS